MPTRPARRPSPSSGGRARRGGGTSRPARGQRRGATGDEPPRGVRGLRILVIGLGLIVFVVAVILIVRGPGGREPGLGPDLLEDPEAAGFGPGARAYALHFVDEDGRLVTEMREVAAKAGRTRQIEAVVEELLSGSLRGNAPALPAGTALRSLFTDAGGVVYIDLTGQAVSGQTGTMTAEYASLAALVRTVLQNFPEYAAVQLLIDGEPEITLAGHFTIERPLRAADWMAR
ncbi:MAG: GerMN domain-containing protein [Candidatus Eiseniibacteriota bacterium]